MIRINAATATRPNIASSALAGRSPKVTRFHDHHSSSGRYAPNGQNRNARAGRVRNAGAGAAHRPRANVAAATPAADRNRARHGLDCPLRDHRRRARRDRVRTHDGRGALSGRHHRRATGKPRSDDDIHQHGTIRCLAAHRQRIQCSDGWRCGGGKLRPAAAEFTARTDATPHFDAGRTVERAARGSPIAAGCWPSRHGPRRQRIF